jgi:glycerate kinase
MGLRVLVAPQEFKGSLTAIEAATAIADGVRDALGPDASIRELPLGDGGPGTVDACFAASEAERVTVEVTGPMGERRSADYALIGDGDDLSAVIESSAACGLVLTLPAERRPGLATSRGVGELVEDALKRGGGAGAARALGLELSDRAGLPIPEGVLGLHRLVGSEGASVLPMFGEAELRIAVDVMNPLLGIEGATAVYGPQKGVRDWELPAFDGALAHWAAAVERDFGLSLADLPGVGAGGGLPAGLLAAAHAAGVTAAIESGAALVADMVGLRTALVDADVVVTGEGSIDAQTGYGKTVAFVADLAAEFTCPTLAVGGVVTAQPPAVADTEASSPDGVGAEGAMALGGAPVRSAAERLVRRWLAKR